VQALVTWPTYGHWFAGHGRGCIPLDAGALGDALPEPTLCGEAVGQPPSRWPAVQLSDQQRRVVRADLARIAALRDFAIAGVVIAPTFVHLLIRIDPERDLSRLVQLVKGALSRALTVAAGDRLPTDATGASLPHHKWWSRQYACLRIGDEGLRERVAGMLERHSDSRAPG
jgi:REP element-mobilizing transposase RayT